jgi:hypothetical protein
VKVTATMSEWDHLTPEEEARLVQASLQPGWFGDMLAVVDDILAERDKKWREHYAIEEEATED